MNRRQFLEGTAGVGILPAIASCAAVWDPEGQARRRREIFRICREETVAHYDEQGNQLPRTPNLGPDGRFRTALAFLDAEETREKGNGIVINTFGEKWRQDSRFYDVVITHVLLMMDKYLTSTARAKILDFLNRRASDTDNKPIYFLGYNDNFPVMDLAFAALAGEVLDRPGTRRQGMEGLERALEMLQRRGMLTEYTAPTYTPVSMLCFADVAQYAHDKRAAALGAAIEQRLWLDVATHFHLPTGVMAGPHSRAYTTESVGQCAQIQMLVYQVIGDRLWLTPPHFLTAAPKQTQHGSAAFLKCSNVWIAASTYRLHPAVAHLLLNKPYPFRVSATSEYGPVKRTVMVRNGPRGTKLEPTGEVFEYPAGELVATTYMTEDYAVGSAPAKFAAGQESDTFFVNFRRKAPARSLEDISTIFARYSGSGQRPGPVYYEVVPPERVMNYITCDEGRGPSVQKDGAVLVHYQANGEIVGKFETLFLNIIVPVFYRDLKRILVGEKEVPALPFEVENPDIVWIEDDILFAAFRPLVLTNHGRRSAIRIVKENDYLNISLYNYEGPARNFTREQLIHTMNGFVAEIGSRSEGTFAQFQERVRSGVVADDVLRGQRVTRYERKGVRLDLCCSIFSNGLKYAMVDGKLQSRAMFQATGMDPSLLNL